MNNLALILFALITATAHADLDFGPSVSEQMQEGMVGAFAAKIDNIIPRSGGYKITFTRVDDNSQDTVSLCMTDHTVEDHYTESDRSMAIQQRVTALREARQSKEAIQLALKGPWSPCVYPTTI
jgi:hypothetical protein